MAIVLLCALAVLTMKLVERRVRQWFQRWEARQAAKVPPPKGRS
jgi:peptidoglycan/LPS O-acetylase OafA/YrhL